jgi:hypothetical protein
MILVLDSPFPWSARSRATSQAPFPGTHNCFSWHRNRQDMPQRQTGAPFAWLRGKSPLPDAATDALFPFGMVTAGTR